MVAQVNTISGNVDSQEKYAADLDQALNVAGTGIYNLKYCSVLGLCLIAAIVEPLGYSYVLPAALCDLNMTPAQRGFIASIPYIGIVVTSFPWGYLVDTRGRKPILIYSQIIAGTVGILAAFMPELISFTAFKFITSLCIACPAATPYTYIGEILPQKSRDLTLSITNALQITGSAFVPLLAWGILPLDFRIDFGAYDFRPWRLLTLVYSLFFLLAAIFLSFGPESPKFLVSQGKYDEALVVLQNIYAGNKGKSPHEFPIKSLKQVDTGSKEKPGFLTSLKVQTAPLLKPPYLKWMCLNSFLMFGIFSSLNGLYMWVPDLLNRVLSNENQVSMTACEVIEQRLNGTTDENPVCIDTIDSITFVINTIASVSCAVIALVISSLVKLIGKKPLLVGIFFIIGAFCVSINFITQGMLFAAFLSTLPILGTGLGPVNAYAVEIFPTQLRGMAVSLTMMVGRSASVIGTNVAGLMLEAVCEATFYTFGGLLLLCGVASFLLPRSRTPLPQKSKIIQETTRL